MVALAKVHARLLYLGSVYFPKWWKILKNSSISFLACPKWSSEPFHSQLPHRMATALEWLGLDSWRNTLFYKIYLTCFTLWMFCSFTSNPCLFLLKMFLAYSPMASALGHRVILALKRSPHSFTVFSVCFLIIFLFVQYFLFVQLSCSEYRQWIRWFSFWYLP